VARSGKTTEMSGLSFVNFGAHYNSYPYSYLTAAAAIGMTRNDVDTFISKLDQCLAKYRKKYSLPTEVNNTEDSRADQQKAENISKDDDNS